ncbi:unnamed protein product [Gongylonema pulchrum]|uniref:Uncharacterized protein n=1 Tax=Gongylonema pulchrum TaxID=637853 RepID=A0A183D884_9BILA|nr:unnamed protein product [Gongylonema pulchrum]
MVLFHPRLQVVDSSGGHTVRECEPSSLTGNRFVVSTAPCAPATPSPQSFAQATVSAVQPSQTQKTDAMKKLVVEQQAHDTTVPHPKAAFRTTTVLSRTSSSSNTTAKEPETVNNGCTSVPSTHVAMSFPVQQAKRLESELTSGSENPVDVNMEQCSTAAAGAEIKRVSTAAQHTEENKSTVYNFLTLVSSEVPSSHGLPVCGLTLLLKLRQYYKGTLWY